MNKMQYELTITQEALNYILQYQKNHFSNEEIILILADLHIVGGMIIPEIHSRNFMFREERRAFDELFPKGYKSYPFSIFVDHQAQIEDALPSQFLIDLSINHKGKSELVFRNPKFE